MKVNKVMSIEIAKQVFWIDEGAYEELQNYLQKIKGQLVNEEFADDVFQDIELRIAELLYNSGATDKKSIDSAQLQQVIEQVGYMDSEETEQALPRRIYLDPENKIVGGVCAGLSVRWGVSAFLLRLVFIALGFLFGLGIVLYLIFWFSLDKNTTRNESFAVHGEPQKAKKIANVKPTEINPLIKLQGIIFLPFSIVGVMVSIVAKHFKTRKKAYKNLFRNILSLVFLVATFNFLIVVYQLNHAQLFPWPIDWLIMLAVMFLIVISWAKYIRKYYLTMAQKQMDKRLKIGSLISALIVLTSMAYFIFATYEHQQEEISESFNLDGQQLKLNFNEQRPQDYYTRAVQFQIRTKQSSSQKIVVHLNYSSEGRNKKVAKQNIKKIHYYFTFAENTLELDSYWLLDKSALNRSQDLDILIEVPVGTMITSNRFFTVNKGLNPLSYNVVAKDSEHPDLQNEYFSSQDYFHEAKPDELKKMSSNEKKVLDDKFCEEFFISESWACTYNINTAVMENNRFDRAFLKDIETIEQVREMLLPNRTLFVSNIKEIRDSVNGLGSEEKEYLQQSDFNLYIRHILQVKSKLINKSAPL